MLGCSGRVPADLGVTDGTLRPCPDTPNCVHTGLGHPEGTRPILVDDHAPLDRLMASLVEVVESMPRTRVITVEGRYLHAEATSRIFRFVDDLELFVTSDRELVVRSASRVGEGDMGVNADRVEALRGLLEEAGLLR